MRSIFFWRKNQILQSKRTTDNGWTLHQNDQDCGNKRDKERYYYYHDAGFYRSKERHFWNWFDETPEHLIPENHRELFDVEKSFRSQKCGQITLERGRQQQKRKEGGMPQQGNRHGKKSNKGRQATTAEDVHDAKNNNEIKKTPKNSMTNGNSITASISVVNTAIPAVKNPEEEGEEDREEEEEEEEKNGNYILGSMRRSKERRNEILQTKRTARNGWTLHKNDQDCGNKRDKERYYYYHDDEFYHSKERHLWNWFDETPEQLIPEKHRMLFDYQMTLRSEQQQRRGGKKKKVTLTTRRTTRLQQKRQEEGGLDTPQKKGIHKIMMKKSNNRRQATTTKDVVRRRNREIGKNTSDRGTKAAKKSMTIGSRKTPSCTTSSRTGATTRRKRVRTKKLHFEKNHHQINPTTAPPLTSVVVQAESPIVVQPQISVTIQLGIDCQKELLKVKRQVFPLNVHYTETKPKSKNNSDPCAPGDTRSLLSTNFYEAVAHQHYNLVGESMNHKVMVKNLMNLVDQSLKYIVPSVTMAQKSGAEERNVRIERLSELLGREIQIILNPLVPYPKKNAATNSLEKVMRKKRKHQNQNEEEEEEGRCRDRKRRKKYRSENYLFRPQAILLPPIYVVYHEQIDWFDSVIPTNDIIIDSEGMSGCEGSPSNEDAFYETDDSDSVVL